MLSMLPSLSFAIIWPTYVWFSGAENVELDVNVGGSHTFKTSTDISCVVLWIPSLALIVILYCGPWERSS